MPFPKSSFSRFLPVYWERSLVVFPSSCFEPQWKHFFPTAAAQVQLSRISQCSRSVYFVQTFKWIFKSLHRWLKTVKMISKHGIWKQRNTAGSANTVNELKSVSSCHLFYYRASTWRLYLIMVSSILNDKQGEHRVVALTISPPRSKMKRCVSILISNVDIENIHIGGMSFCRIN